MKTTTMLSSSLENLTALSLFNQRAENSEKRIQKMPYICVFESLQEIVPADCTRARKETMAFDMHTMSVGTMDSKFMALDAA